MSIDNYAAVHYTLENYIYISAKNFLQVVNFEWARGGMSLITEKQSNGVTVSRLLIQKAIRNDSGTYSCAPQTAHPAQVKIIVLEQGGSTQTNHFLREISFSTNSDSRNRSHQYPFFPILITFPQSWNKIFWDVMRVILPYHKKSMTSFGIIVF